MHVQLHSQTPTDCIAIMRIRRIPVNAAPLAACSRCYKRYFIPVEPANNAPTADMRAAVYQGRGHEVAFGPAS